MIAKPVTDPPRDLLSGRAKPLHQKAIPGFIKTPSRDL
jgi:hypothetical protein